MHNINQIIVRIFKPSTISLQYFFKFSICNQILLTVNFSGILAQPMSQKMNFRVFAALLQVSISGEFLQTFFAIATVISSRAFSDTVIAKPFR